jgi:hypothetical protein
MSATMMPTVAMRVQLACEELGEQPAIKFSLKRGQLAATIIVPVCSQDTEEVRQNKINLCERHFRAELQDCSHNSGA